MADAVTFVELVAEMRSAQKSYFAIRGMYNATQEQKEAALFKSKDLERKVDAAILEIRDPDKQKELF